MLDIKFVRENPDKVKENIKKKFQDHKIDLVDEVIEKEKEMRAMKQRIDDLRAQRNSLSKQIGGLMKNGQKEEAEKVKQQVSSMADELKETEEIRIRINQPMILWDGRREYFLDKLSGRLSVEAEGSYYIKESDISAMLTFLSRYSIYAYEEELKSGFLTLEGGHRVGVTGQIRMEGEKVEQLAYVGSLNIRIAHQKIGCAKEILPFIRTEQRVRNTLFVSSVGIGKTTLLRDSIRLISGDETSRIHFKVGVVDERSEIAACCHGIPQNNLGIRTDVIDRCKKAVGMRMLLRSMSPDVIAVDELGSMEDFQAVDEVLHCGCSILGTIHAADMLELQQKEQLQKWVEQKIFERYVILKKDDEGRRHFMIYDGTWEKIWSD